MAFKEVVTVDCETTISLGGSNRKTGKANPTQIEGYYVGSKQVADSKKKSGFSYIYVFSTPKGNVGVWGKTDLDKKMLSATVGAMTRVTQSGMASTPNGDMYKFKVEVDTDNAIEIATETASDSVMSAGVGAGGGGGRDEAEYDQYEGADDGDLDGDEKPLDEIQPARPARAAANGGGKAFDAAARKSQVQNLLSRKQ